MGWSMNTLEKTRALLLEYATVSLTIQDYQMDWLYGWFWGEELGLLGDVLDAV